MRALKPLALVFCLLLAACVPVTRPVFKIGLVAPFEGRYRGVGYEVIYAVRLAVREANARGVAGHAVELLALDDSGDAAMAVTQARKAAADPQVVAVIGDWLDATTLAATPEYAAAGLPLLATTAAPQLDPSASIFRLWPSAAALNAQITDTTTLRRGPPEWGDTPFFGAAGPDPSANAYLVAPAPMPADAADATFADRFRAISNGVEPNAYSVLAYDAARLLFDAVARANGAAPSRAGVAAALLQSDYTGLSGQVSFNSGQAWAEAPGWRYRLQAGKIVQP